MKSSPLTKEQIRLHRILSKEVGFSQTFIYQSEWLGYLPFGQYHWISCATGDVEIDANLKWSREDLQNLVEAKLLQQISSSTDPEDEECVTIQYMLISRPS